MQDAHEEEGQVPLCITAMPRGMEVPPFKATLDKTMPYVDFLFGNETECMALGRAKRLGDDIALVALATGQETNIFNKTSTCMSKRNSPRENDPSKNQSNRL